MSIQVCASCYVVDFEKEELLMIYNKKLGKWLQPGGHIEGDENPLDTAMREVKEETGVEFYPIGIKFLDSFEPIAVEKYNTKIGPQIDIQYVGKPLHKNIINNEQNDAQWISFSKVMESQEIDDEIKEKINYILNNY